MDAERTQQAARWLFDAHRAHARFEALPAAMASRSIAESYAIQDAFVALKREARSAQVAGYKIAITTQAMRQFVGFDDSIAGVMLDRQIQRSRARIRIADYGHVLIECEIAFEIGADVTARGTPYDRTSIAAHVAAVMPAFEIADDRHADYKLLAANVLCLPADNAWNEGAVLGAPVRDWQGIDLGAVHGRLTINDAPAGEGFGRDVLGHPLEALAWLANHLLARGRQLERGQQVITGSVVVSKFPQAGDRLRFELAGLGEVRLEVRA
jgi:2-keto-4-pentenoate hydratase